MQNISKLNQHNPIKSQKTIGGMLTTIYDLPPEYQELRSLIHPASVIGISFEMSMAKNYVRFIDRDHKEMTYEEAIAYIKSKFEEHKDPSFYISMIEQDRKAEERAYKERLAKAAKRPKERVSPGVQLAKRRVRRILTKSTKKTGTPDKAKALAYLEKHLTSEESIQQLKEFFEL